MFLCLYVKFLLVPSTVTYWLILWLRDCWQPTIQLGLWNLTSAHRAELMRIQKIPFIA